MNKKLTKLGRSSRRSGGAGAKKANNIKRMADLQNLKKLAKRDNQLNF